MAPTSGAHGGNSVQGKNSSKAPTGSVDPFASLLGETSTTNSAPKTTTTTGLSGGSMSSFNFIANNGANNSNANGVSAMDRIQQAQQAARMQQMQQYQQMQQMQMMKMMQQGASGSGQMNMRMQTMNTGMNTGVYAAGSVKTINPSLFQEKKKDKIEVMKDLIIMLLILDTIQHYYLFILLNTSKIHFWPELKHYLLLLGIM